MAAVDEILAGIDLDQLAAHLGTDPQTARAAAAAAIPSLIGSLQANSADPDGAASLVQALGQHSEGFGDQIDLSSVDTEDGRKILAHMFADQPDRLQPLGGLGGSLLSRLLPLLAPIVMSYLARKLGMGGGGRQDTGGGILGDLLGGILGGGRPSSGSSGGGLGDILGDILGGGQTAPSGPSGGGLGDILGDVLGGGGSPEPSRPASFPQADSPFTPVPREGGRLQIPLDDEPAAPAAPAGPTAPAGGDVLGGLLDQILGRSR